MKIFKTIAIIFLCFMSICFFGCKDSDLVNNENVGSDSVNNEDIRDKEDDFGISITLPDIKEIEVYSRVQKISSYKITVKQNEWYYPVEKAGPGETVKIRLNGVGTYDVLVVAIGNNGKEEIASGSTSVTLDQDDRHKNVEIKIVPYERIDTIVLRGLWEKPDEEQYGEEDAERYDVSIYCEEKLVNTYENVSLYQSYDVKYSAASTYKIKIEAKKADLTVVGSGEVIFTIEDYDRTKYVSIKIVGKIDDSESAGNGEIVTMGRWPQSLADVTGIKLAATGKTYDGSNEEYAGNDGNKYVKVGESYYKVEPITWRVIAYNSDGSKKLLADKIYSGISYYGTDSNRDLAEATIYPNNYKYSNIRAYLNSTKNQFEIDGGTPTEYDVDWTDAGFLTNAFTAAELAKIKTTTVDNRVRSTGYNENPYVCENTEDKVYILSYREAAKKLYGFNINSDRTINTTAYAKANGVLQMVYLKEELGGDWWLRSPTGITGYSSLVRYISSCGDNYSGNVKSKNVGVVPALTVTE